MSNEDDALNDAVNTSNALAKELTALSKNIAVGTGIISVLLVIVIAAIVFSKGF